MARIVLIADDSPAIQKKALGILKGEGFEVETVSNGVAAIKRLAVLNPVVILADVSMPGRDGYEVCEFVKKSADLSHVPVLLVASDMEPYDDARGAEVGADGIIKKPFEAHDLIAIVVKFAEQCEAAMPAVPAPAVAPTPAPEPTQDFVAFGQEPDQAPTVVQHVPPDFSAAPEGVAFAQPGVEEAPGYSSESQPAEMEVSYSAPQSEAEIVLEPVPAPEFVDTIPAPEPLSAPAAETPLVVEEQPAPSPFAAPPPFPAARAPSHLEGLEAATPEPVFIEEQRALDSEEPSSAAEFGPMVFGAPQEIAEPVLMDETVPAPPAPEPAVPTALEPQLEAEAPVASPEIPVEHPPESPHIAPSVTASSLDSFSLDDAAAGQVHFASEVGEVAPIEVVPSAPAPEPAYAEMASPEPAPETASPEPASEASYAVTAPAEPAPEVAYAQMAPAEPTPEASYPEMALPEPAPEAFYAEIAPPEATPEASYAEMAPAEPAPEASYAEMASAEPAPEAAYAEMAPAESAPEASYAEMALPEAPPEAALQEPSAESAAPPPAYDWGLIYSVVHKVVVRMSPPVLPFELVEELARRLAEEIAMEITSESSQPPE